MTENISESVNTQDSTISENTPSIQNKATNYQTIEYLIYFAFGILEVLLVFRLILKLTGASMGSIFVRFVYGITGVFTLPFSGMFHQGVNAGIETVSIFEPATIVSIIVYAVLAVGIVKFIRILSRKKIVN